MQCLSTKLPNWHPEAGDEEFEKDSKLCFVTGISKEGPSEFNIDGFEPVKHGILEALIDNYTQEEVGACTLDCENNFPMLSSTRTTRKWLFRCIRDASICLRECAHKFWARLILTGCGC